MTDDTPKPTEVVNGTTQVVGEKITRHDSVLGHQRKVEINRQEINISDDDGKLRKAHQLMAQIGELLEMHGTKFRGFGAVFFFSKQDTTHTSAFEFHLLKNLDQLKPSLEVVAGMGLQELAVAMGKDFGRTTLGNARYQEEMAKKIRIERPY